jgi:formylglycine-generating enzyme required for sulfatase activity
MRNIPLVASVTLICGISTTRVAAQSCIGDIAIDGRIDGGDLGVMLANWGAVTPAAMSHACDIDANEQVDGADLGLMLANWGNCPAGTWCTVIDAQPDPAVVTDQNLRAAIEASGYPWRIWDRNTKIEMLLVPPGMFTMGCSPSLQHACTSDEGPAHLVTLTRPYYMGRYEVTQEQWRALMPYDTSCSAEPPDTSRTAVGRVSWMGAEAFATRANLRLPTEAEWEYACRAGTTTAYHNGSNNESTAYQVAYFAQTIPPVCHISLVGSFASNDLGFHDMLGNVLEWVSDNAGGYTADAQVDPQGPAPDGDLRHIVRGGDWGSSASGVRCSSRYSYPRSYGEYTFGFRVARNP